MKKRLYTTTMGVLLAALALPIAASAEPTCRQVDPRKITLGFESAFEVTRLHLACIDTTVPQKGRLLLFFPGTRAEPQRYTMLIEEAARTGLHAISLSYENRLAVNYTVCPFLDDPACYENIRHEIIYGDDVFPPVHIDHANSAIGRLTSLLRYLDAQYPSEGWGQYLDRQGNLIWSSLVVSGHSQGGGHATMVARDHEVARLVIFSWADRLRGDYGATRADALAPWIKKPFATPADRLYAFEHVRDRGVALRRVMWQVLGMTRFGPEVDVDTTPPPYGGSHTLSTNVTPTQPAASAGPHNSVGVDDFTPLDANGRPVLTPVWHYLFDVPAAPGK